MMKSESFYNRRKPDGLAQSVVTNLGGGINEYLPPHAIPDNQLVSGLDYWSEDGASLKHFYPGNHGEMYAYYTSRVYSDEPYPGTFVIPAVTWNGINSPVYPMMADWKSPYHAKKINGPTLALQYELRTYAFIAKPTTTGALLYITQADKYSVYWSSDMNILLVQKHSDRSIFTVTLPSGVYPKEVVSHKARLFLLDHNNTLWWCKGGDLTEWYGEVPDGEYHPDDAGYWFVDSSDRLNRICVFRDNLYIYGDETIYCFAGFSQESFHLSRLFTGIGTYPYEKRSLTVDSTFMYFTYKNKVYQFDGTARMPMLISEPVLVNGNLVNGVSSGIKPWKEYFYEANAKETEAVLSLHNDQCGHLYWYPFENERKVYAASSYTIQQRIGVFDTKRRTWWKFSGFTYGYSTYVDDSKFYLFPANEDISQTIPNSYEPMDRNFSYATYWMVSHHTDYTYIDTAGKRTKLRLFSVDTAVGGSGTRFTTKTFSARPSDNMLLTDIYIVVRSNLIYPDGTGIDSGHVGVYLESVNQFSTFEDDEADLADARVLWNRSWNLYSLTDYAEDANIMLGKKFVTLHVPVSMFTEMLSQDMNDTPRPDDSVTFDGLISTYPDTVPPGNYVTFMPSHQFRLRMYVDADNFLELHKIELRYRVTEASR